MKAKAKPKQPKWYEDVKLLLCWTCTHRLRGIVDKPGRYCKYMASVEHRGRPACERYKESAHRPKCCE